MSTAKFQHPNAHHGSAIGLAGNNLALRAGDGLSPAGGLTDAPHVALLDRDGVVVGVNRAWRRFSVINGGAATAGLASNYLEICECAQAQDEPGANEASLLVRAALSGRPATSSLTYPCPDRAENPRYFRMYTVSLPGRHRGVLVVHLDVTAETQHSREWPPPAGTRAVPRSRAVTQERGGTPQRAR